MTQYAARDKARFEAKCAPITESGCWIWLGASGRYGNLTIRGVHMDAHRFSWILYRGPVPEGMCVLHRCDIGLCVNPSHLFLGSSKQNTQDMLAKGRHRFSTSNAPRGQRHWKRRRNVHAFP